MHNQTRKSIEIRTKWQQMYNICIHRALSLHLRNKQNMLSYIMLVKLEYLQITQNFFSYCKMLYLVIVRLIWYDGC